MTASISRSLLALLATLALAAGLAACGSDDETTTSEESASAEEVTLTTSDTSDGYTWDLSATPTAETKSVTFKNESKEPHALIFARINEGFTLDEAFKLQGREGSAEIVAQSDQQTSPGPGETVEIKVTGDIKPGSYAMICPISGKDGPHYKLGQAAEFEIQ
jgi:uncharacterized cupredoxin-like copper-binding protein